MVEEFSPFSQEHLDKMMEEELEKVNMDYTPEESAWILENSDNGNSMGTQSSLKAMWFEELLENGVIEGRITIITWNIE